jgi:NitT/TauT family transport system permease protein
MKDSIITSKKRIYTLLSLIFWLLVWEVASLLINVELYLPSPFSTFKALFNMIFESNFWIIVFTSISRVIIGFLISCILGISLGILCGINNFLYSLWQPFIVAIKSTPVMSFIIIALVWFKSDNVPIFICCLMCLPIIWTATIAGINQVDNRLLEMSKLFSVSKKNVITGIYFHSITPYISSAMITALGLGWKVTVAAEVLSSPRNSIGIKLLNAKVYLESAELFAWTIVVIILSMIFEYLFKYIISKATKFKGIK